MAEKFTDGNSSEFDAGGERKDQLFDVLSHSRRRFVLDTLQSVEIPVSVGDLVTELARWESERPDPSGDRKDAVELALVHTHLPKMADAGFVRYDALGRTVRLADRTEEVQTHLGMMATDTGGDRL